MENNKDIKKPVVPPKSPNIMPPKAPNIAKPKSSDVSSFNVQEAQKASKFKNNKTLLNNNLQNKPMTKVDLENNRESKTIVKQEKINKKTSVPKSKTVKAITISVAIVLVLALLSTLVYFSFIKPTLPMDIDVNFTTETTLHLDSVGGSTSQRQKVMPGDDIDCSYLIKNEAKDGSPAGGLYVRLIAYALCEDNYYSNLFSYYFKDTNWHAGNDGYFYYNGVLDVGETIDAVKYLHINESLGSEFAGKTVSVCFVAEALQAVEGSTASIEAMWPTAPQEWMDTVK